jgi:protein gp37
VSGTTAIEWTEATWNPVTGCDKISPGCDHCYALALAKRLKAMGQPKYQADGNPATSGPGFAVTVHEEAVWAPLGWRRPRTVFVNSMSDVAHPRVPREFLARIWAAMALAHRHTFQVLTKRPNRLAALLASGGFARDVAWAAARTPYGLVPPEDAPGWAAREGLWRPPWPLPNVHVGTSIENDGYAWRAGFLRRTPAALRFLSLEPLLGPVPSLDLDGIGWVIAGGESGPGRRPPEAAWVRGIRDQCTAAGVPFFFKQWGGPTPKAGGRLLDGRTWDQVPGIPAACPTPHTATEGNPS